jgi:CheY-like chemotaxis protein
MRRDVPPAAPPHSRQSVCVAEPPRETETSDATVGVAAEARRVRRPDPRHPFTADHTIHVSALVPLHDVRIMLVEDDADARNIMRRVLEHCGAIVTVAETAAAALRRLRAMPRAPHVLVSDIALPAHDGFWLLSQIRAMAPLAGLPAIAITAHRDEYYREQALDAGFQDYFQKPLDLVAFSRAIARLTR